MTVREYTVRFTKSEQDSINYFLDNMRFNKAYRPAHPDSPQALAELEAMKLRYVAYRHGWREIPEEAIAKELHDRFVSEMKLPPHSVDIEIAAICDLACPHCYRQYIVTPDKLISDELFHRVIDQCVELGVPSIKLNWRGEPLLNPRLPDYVAYAKQKGIMEIIINTNAVTLSESKSRALIDAGLDMMIYSFDGGTAPTYDKIRVGRFEENRFENVYANIVQFHRIREEMGSPFPRTRIQMVLTPDAMGEVDEFRRRFEPIVDDVLVKAYEERGWGLTLFSDDEKVYLKGKISERSGKNVKKLPQTMIWKKSEGEFLLATGRLPCQQIYQRLMVSYDGSVYMCCNDWGNEHPIGYIDSTGYEGGMQDYESVQTHVQRGDKGFALLREAKMPTRYNAPEHRVSTLSEIWDGVEVNRVRRMHIEGKINELAVCRKCTFRDTFLWEKL